MLALGSTRALKIVEMKGDGLLFYLSRPDESTWAGKSFHRHSRLRIDYGCVESASGQMGWTGSFVGDEDVVMHHT